MPVLDAVDTSNNQGPAVVGIGDQLQQLGVQGWWHKATQSDNFRDQYWPQVRINSRPFRYRGPYHWLQPNHDVAAQFANFVGYVGDLEDGESIQLDIEDPGGLSDAVVFAAVDMWEDRYPGRVFVYTGRFYMPYNPTGKHVESYLIDRLIIRYGNDLKWWLPWYTNSFPAGLPTSPVMWQWAGGAGGVLIDEVGRIDSNQIIDQERLDAASGYGDTPLEPDSPPDVPAVAPKELDVVLFTNAETYPNADPSGAPYPAQTVFWVLMPDGSKRHVTTWAEVQFRVDAGGKICVESTGNIQSLPDYVAVQPGVAAVTYDEAFAQAVIGAVYRLLSDETIVPNDPGLQTLKFHFERS